MSADSAPLQAFEQPLRNNGIRSYDYGCDSLDQHDAQPVRCHNYTTTSIFAGQLHAGVGEAAWLSREASENPARLARQGAASCDMVASMSAREWGSEMCQRADI